MKRNYIIILIIIIVCGAVFGFLYMNNFDINNLSLNNLNPNNPHFKVPDGFKNKGVVDNETVLTNGKTTIKIKEMKYTNSLDTFITKYYDVYGKDYEINNTTEDYQGTVVKGIVGKEPNKTHYHYWYNKNNKTYHIYMYGENNPGAIKTIVTSTK